MRQIAQIKERLVFLRQHADCFSTPLFRIVPYRPGAAGPGTKLTVLTLESPCEKMALAAWV
jgi:hypothetical protein